jgi:hypothetical protein
MPISWPANRNANPDTAGDQAPLNMHTNGLRGAGVPGKSSDRSGSSWTKHSLLFEAVARHAIPDVSDRALITDSSPNVMVGFMVVAGFQPL